MAIVLEGGKNTGISLVLPAFNEQECIVQSVQEAVSALEDLGIPFEIIVVNDGSTDATAALVTGLAQTDSRIHLLDLPRNQGYGNALRQGFLASRMPLVSFTDSDCQFFLEDLGPMVERAARVPVVVGWRQDRKDPWRRKFLSRGFNLLADWMVGTGVRDIDCALKVFRREDLLHILPATGGFLVNTEMVVKARALGLEIEQIPVRHRPRAGGASKVRLTEVPKVFLGLARFWFSEVAFPRRMTNLKTEPGNDLWFEAIGLLFLVSLACAFFLGNIRAPLLEPTEARYAEIPRQMLETGSWLVPKLQGEPYLDKPPLFYWLVMSAYKVGGVSDRVARLVPGIAGVLTVLVSWAWLRSRAGPRGAWIAAFLLLTCARFVHYERMLAMDSVLCLLVVAGIGAGDRACMPGRFSRLWWLACSIFVGLGMLTKGFVAVPLIAGPLLIWMLLDKRLSKPTLVDLLWGGCIALLPLLAWMIPVALTLDGFLEYFVWKHHIVRFMEPFDHAGPFWYYLPGLLFGLGPWLILVPGLITRLTGKKALRHGGGLQVQGLILTTLAVNLAFFSLAGCKRPIYSMAFVPFAALGLGLHLDSTLPKGWIKMITVPTVTARGAFLFTSAIWIAVGLGCGWKGWIEPKIATLCVSTGAGLFALMGLVTILGRGLSWGPAMVACALLGVVACWEVLPGYHEGFSLRGHLRQAMKTGVVPETLRASPARVELVCYPHRWDSAGFYLPQANIVVYGPDQMNLLEDHLRKNPDSYLLMKPGRALRDLLARFPTRAPRIENPNGAVAVTKLEERGLTRAGK